ncbi:PREDICTED: trafficking protein particle complex subunit 2-like protein [Amphimedon queenslandica]|uniref:Trafficking protein particle complex subunit 2-like protein n=1 Tax=Amphimedon queenslandica TaxID=400682 RepID=A0A1X7VCD1_AMPQE|nr:PREDICTED: trafficking protein particle complex subunit 2-like protein [Amphimedon queenslandica]|eukprot:XP_003385067.1 PREDICTED: trafficking protein particle complex subunit 2-like protein [Amphimedon queenslandica]
MAVVCVSVISKENFPLYIKTASVHADNEMTFHHIVHTAIDVIEEKISSVGTARAASDFREHFLGALYPSEQYKIYGYATNTRIKFVIICENSQSKDNEMGPMFKKLHTAYVDMFCNPFYTLNAEITSKKFDQLVSQLITDSENKINR